ncbi:MAG: hypothetical protein K6E62_01900 [Lachnospiraceae bacterium]|nr:hypothetical protein [Lachnospiraceae bacterium]
MKLYNCSLNSIKEVFETKRIVFFGCGSWLKQIEYTEFEELKDQFAYVIDNAPCGDVVISGKCLNVYPVDKLKEEQECIVVLTSPIYQYEMFCQLEEMKLNDGIRCYSLPFMQHVTRDSWEDEWLKEVTNVTEKRIPKTIHGFWFSGDEKPDLYKKCVDSWYKNLPDYEIIEWNKNNYDWHKHPFLERAIELEAWAFASDYARLDVLHQYGGLYLDMDVEVFQPFDPLLGNSAILSFSNHILIDLAVMGAEKNNGLVGKMLRVYDGISVPEDRKGFSKWFQPTLMRKTLAEAGIKMNGRGQLLKEGTAVFPKDFFMPLDFVLFQQYDKTENTYCVHYDNFGWSFSGESKREKKINDNRKLWSRIEN